MEYYSLNQYLKDRFGTKVYKLSIDAGCTCPNRDGTIGVGGCIFCSAGGSGEFAVRASGTMTVTEQLEAAKERVAAKAGAGAKYIAYFQSFTSTYGDEDVLLAKFREAINHPEVVAVSIGTRPDCISEGMLEGLKELNEFKPVWVELGLQTIHEATAKYIRRGYELRVYDGALSRLNNAGIEVITHVILGLPGETEEMMKATVSYVAASGAKGIKLSLLHVLAGTDLALDFVAGKFKCMSMEEYISLVVECLKLLPKDMVVHRLTGDGDKRLLIAPLWSADKKKVLNAMNKAIREG